MSKKLKQSVNSAAQSINPGASHQPTGPIGIAASLAGITGHEIRVIQGEPRVSDGVLAVALGMADPRMTKRLVERNREELESYGAFSVTVTENTDPKGRGRPGQEYWLNEDQALLVCLLSRTRVAAQVRRKLMQVFKEYRDGQKPSDRIALRYDGKPRVIIEKLPELVEKIAIQVAYESSKTMPEQPQFLWRLETGLKYHLYAELEKRLVSLLDINQPPIRVPNRELRF